MPPALVPSTVNPRAIAYLRVFFVTWIAGSVYDQFFYDGIATVAAIATGAIVGLYFLNAPTKDNTDDR